MVSEGGSVRERLSQASMLRSVAMSKLPSGLQGALNKSSPKIITKKLPHTQGVFIIILLNYSIEQFVVLRVDRVHQKSKIPSLPQFLKMAELWLSPPC